MVIIRHLIGVLFWWYSYYQLQEYCTLLACNYKIIIFFFTLVLQDALFDIAIAHKATSLCFSSIRPQTKISCK